MPTKPKLFRDPIHDTIALPQDTEENQLIVSLLDAPEVQRLRRIRQLGLTSVVYPGAEHSRFQHSLGVLWVAHQILARVGYNRPISPQERVVTLCGALLHDVGHGPMSHALEAVTHIHHERWTEALIAGRTLDGQAAPTPLSERLRAYDPSLPDKLVSLYSKGPLAEGVPPFARDIVSSQLDADRLDYILRDGHHTGVRIGTYDLARILAQMDVSEDGHLAIQRGALEAVEGYLLARFHMYKQVYLHKTSRCAERMLEAMLVRAKQLKQEGPAPAYWPTGPFGQLILGERLSPMEFASLDDADLYVALKAWAHDSDRALSDLAAGLLLRKLYKPVTLPADEGRANELLSAAQSLARVRGFEPQTAVLYDTSRDSLYRPFTGAKERSASIRIIGSPTERISYIEERSEVVAMLSRLQLNQRLLCVHPDLKEPIRRMVSQSTGMS